jgi:hypothetical protein
MVLRCRRLAATLLVLALALSVRAAAGESRAVVWAVNATGEGAAALREQFSRSLAGGLAAAGLAVVSRAEIERRLAVAPGLVGCETSPCLKRVAQLLGVDRLVRAHVEVFGASYVFRVEDLGPDGTIRISLEGRCDVCTVVEINEQLSQAALRLVRTAVRPLAPAMAPGPPAAPRPAPTPMVVETAPAPAPAGAMEPTPPAPLLPAPAPHEPPRRLRLWTWTGLGLAAALIATGAVLVAYDGGASCTPAHSGAACPRIYDTASSGWAVTGLGLAALGGAGVLFWLDRSPAPLSPTPRSAGLLLRGRF